MQTLYMGSNLLDRKLSAKKKTIWLISSVTNLKQDLMFWYHNFEVTLTTRVQYSGAYMTDNMVYIYLCYIDEARWYINSNRTCTIEFSSHNNVPEWAAIDNAIRVDGILLPPICRLIEEYCRPAYIDNIGTLN